jgi:DNA polymerase III alpha subunit
MDIDIDLRPDFNPDEFFDVRYASMDEDGEIRKHPAGVYFQEIPVDKITGLAAIPYKQSEEMGYTKLDFLHLSILKDFSSKEQIRELLEKEPDWSLLKNEKVVSNLFHIGNHYGVVNRVNPQSVLELSDILALIRPGKRHLLDDYLESPENIRPELYTKKINSDMRKSHTIPYALLIVLQLHLVKQHNENIT